MSDAHSRVLTYIAKGEDPARVTIRYEDPPNLVYRMAAQGFLAQVDHRLKAMVNLIVRREMDEEDA